MHKLAVGLIFFFTAANVFAQDAITFGANDWPWWRGPNRNGHADPNQKPPLKWSENENVFWKANVPGRGHGSPIVVGDQIFLATADQKDLTQSVLCYNRKTGDLVWSEEIHRGPFPKNGNGKASFASSTGVRRPACVRQFSA